MKPLTYHAGDEAATVALGAALAELLPDGATVALCGALGAGKTRLVQAICEAAGIDRREVVSPTFMLIHEYLGRRTVYHLDAYRIRDEDEFLALGPEEYFDGDGLVLVEWADRVEGSLPPDRIQIRMEITGPESRRFELTGLGARSAEVISGLRSLGLDGTWPEGGLAGGQ